MNAFDLLSECSQASPPGPPGAGSAFAWIATLDRRTVQRAAELARAMLPPIVPVEVII